MKKYGDYIAFTNLKEIEKCLNKQKQEVLKYMKSDINNFATHFILANIENTKNKLISRWLSNPSRCLLVQEDEINCYLNLSNKYTIEMKKYAESKKVNIEDSKDSICDAHNQMNKYSDEQLKKMYLMCNENIELMRRMMLFLSYECIDTFTIGENLSKENPVPFIIDNNTDSFMSIPCKNKTNKYINNYGYRYEMLDDKDGIEILQWMMYCREQRESFEERYIESNSKKCRL